MTLAVKSVAERGNAASEDPVEPENARRRVVVAGEFSAGKSSVINLMLRQALLLPSIGHTKRPLARIHHSTASRTLSRMQDEVYVEAPDADAALRNTEASEVLIYTPLDLIPGAELIEMPAPPDGRLDPEWIELATSADLFIWCTIASQAWRLSEKACIEQLPEDMVDRSFLAVTRNDLVRSDEDRAKLSKRLETDAAYRFSNFVFISAGSARMARLHEDDVWQETGGPALVERVLYLEGAETPVLATEQATVLPFAPTEIPDMPETNASEPAEPEHPDAKPLPKASTQPPVDAAVLAPLADLPGFIAACVVETEAAQSIAELGEVDFDRVAAKSSLFLRLQMIALPAIGAEGAIEDIVISTRQQFQLLRRPDTDAGFHVVVLVSRTGGNLGQARLVLRAVTDNFIDVR